MSKLANPIGISARFRVVGLFLELFHLDLLAVLREAISLDFHRPDRDGRLRRRRIDRPPAGALSALLRQRQKLPSYFGVELRFSPGAAEEIAKRASAMGIGRQQETWG